MALSSEEKKNTMKIFRCTANIDAVIKFCIIQYKKIYKAHLPIEEACQVIYTINPFNIWPKFYGPIQI